MRQPSCRLAARKETPPRLRARRQASSCAFLYAQRGLLAALLADAAARPAEARRLPYLLSAYCDVHGLLARAPGDAAALQEVRQGSAHAGARPWRSRVRARPRAAASSGATALHAAHAPRRRGRPSEAGAAGRLPPLHERAGAQPAARPRPQALHWRAGARAHRRTTSCCWLRCAGTSWSRWRAAARPTSACTWRAALASTHCVRCLSMRAMQSL